MKRVRVSIAAMCLLTIAVTPLGSCRKQNLPGDPRNGDTDYRQCQIVHIDQYNDDDSDDVTLYHWYRDITYNSKGNPIRIDPQWVATGSPWFQFFYDKKGRLIHLGGLYTTAANEFEHWHNYEYDATGRIVGDSSYTFGDTAHLGDSYARGYAHFYYDHLNRIVKVISSGVENGESHGPDSSQYHYDAAGNLDGAIIPYDNQVNPLLTNKIWRFLARDYSVNNRVKVASYNDHGLPVTIDVSKGGSFTYGFIWNLYIPGNRFIFQYDCSGMEHKQDY